ncbi:MAG: terminase small subunit [Alphaproteobacteria bacterium]
MSGLTARQEQFCREYLIDLNATQAAIRAGYSENSAKEIGSENLTKPHIQRHIEDLKQSRMLRVTGERKPNEQELETDADRVIRELKIIAFANPADFFDIVDGELKLKPEADIVVGENAGAILRVGVDLKKSKESDAILHLSFQNKMRALELLMQHYGMLKTPSTPPPRTQINVISTYDLSIQTGDDDERTVE